MADNNLFDVELLIKETKHEAEEEHKRHENEINSLNQKLIKLQHIKEMLMNNIDVDKVTNAKKYIFTEGVKRNFYGDALTQLNKVKQDVLDGFKILKSEYIGCKDYDRFIGQGITCSYGCCPSHGRVVFEIGMVNRKAEISKDDACDILYFLNLLSNEDTRNKVLLEGQ